MGKATRMAYFVNRYGTNGSFRSGSGSSQATNHCKIIAAILLTTTLAACTGTTKPECVRPQAGNECKSSNSGFSKPSPVVKSETRPKKDRKPAAAPQPEDPPMPPSGNIPAPESDNNTPPKTPTTETPNTGGSGSNAPGQGTDAKPPNQSNSNDIKGFDPFGGLYGPGT